MALTGSATAPADKDRWQTPPHLFRRLDRDYGPCDLDAAANAENALCPRWLGPGGLAEDALTVDWADYGRRIFLNPPYSQPLLTTFVGHAAAQVHLGVERVVCLLPATTEVRWFQLYVYDYFRRAWRPGVSVEFLPGRVHFIRPGAGPAVNPPAGSLVVVFDPPAC